MSNVKFETQEAWLAAMAGFVREGIIFEAHELNNGTFSITLTGGY